MRNTIRFTIFCAVFCILYSEAIYAQSDSTTTGKRLTLGGYGEAVYNYNFFSDNVFRYSHANNYTESKGHGRVDLPHAVLMLGYDFGRGWSFGTEIEFEHGGTESAIEMESEETGEFEKEIERGGEVALEQFWIQKRFSQSLNLRMGHMVVPVGMTNNNHLPNRFYGVYRPEGENTIMPCTWHETGVSLWGKTGHWRYEAMVLPALNSNMFNAAGWIHDGSASAYEFRVANHLAGAARVDYTGVKNLRLSLSGYVGNSFNNDIVTEERSRYADVKGTVMIGAFDFAYSGKAMTVRGNVDYGHLNDASLISAHNKSQINSSNSPYPHTDVGSAAVSAGLEAGVNLLARRSDGRRLVTFGHYEYYDSFIPSENQINIGWTERHVLSCGVNYFPLPEIAIKAEAGIRLLKEQYNDEPYVAVGITWSGMFHR